MSDPATYAFLSVYRSGLAALIQSGGAATDVRVPVPLSLSVGTTSAGALPPLALFGPGDVVGFDSSSVSRIWPGADTERAEPNYFALVEFAEPDLPWRYTPDATQGDRLTPWLCVVVAEEGEIAETVAPTNARPLGSVTLAGSALPDLSQAWAWAHAQVLESPEAPATDFTPATIAALWKQDPRKLSARLLCPRQLHAVTRYRAFLVPTFERGRLAGLGQSASGANRTALAWLAGQASATLPVYFSWSFRTGEVGDFASLVVKLRPVRDLPESVWRRSIALSSPGASPPNWQPVNLESALIPVNAAIPDWNTLDTHGFTAALALRTNTPGPKLESPLYGRWLAATATLATSSPALPAWFHQLNADPRTRAASGLGTQAVQNEQQELLAGAWAQVQEVRAANERLRLAQLARELATSIHARHFATVPGDTFLQISAPLHARVRASSGTVRAQLAASPIASGAFAPVYRRVTRPLGSLAARQRVNPTAAGPGVLARMNSGTLSVAPPPKAPAPSVTGASRRLGDFSAVLQKEAVEPENLHSVVLPHQFVVRDITVTRASQPSSTDTHLAIDTHLAVDPHLSTDTHIPTDTRIPHSPPVTDPPAASPPALAPTAFRDAVVALMAQLSVAPAPGVQMQMLDLDGLHNTLLALLHPQNTVEAPLKNQLGTVPAGPRRADPIEPVMAAPSFPQAMYRSLTDLGTEWLLPGLNQMPADAVGLFLTNWRFVEAFLTGLNHEMARKLLWNGYPTDQRGTYFRRFWDAGAGASADGDIGPIHAWTKALGSNRLVPGDPLVLLVRGELIRRYPNVIVYAAAAEPSPTGRVPGANEKHPIFLGHMVPDVAIFGFDLDSATARGNPGWFFVLQEHPSEPRFGLAAPVNAFGAQPATWQALGWDHLAADPQALENLRYVDLDAPLPRDAASPDATGAVWHASGSVPSRAADIAHITFREPKRYAVHGSILIPPPAPGEPQ